MMIESACSRGRVGSTVSNEYQQVTPEQAHKYRGIKMWVLGIDVGKKELVVRLELDGVLVKEGEFTNTGKGFNALKKWLKKADVPLDELRICMESTNVYWEEVADYFYGEGATVHVVNPVRIKGFARSQMERNKTDKIDAKVIAQFARAFPDLRMWEPPNPTQRKLRALHRHRETLTQAITQETNRLQTTKEQAVIASIETIISTLEQQKAEIEKEIEQLIGNDPDLKEKLDLLVSIPGIGAKTAQSLLAEMYDIENYDSARSAAADAGVTPAHHESGTSVRRKPRISRVGKTAVRSALFFPAMTAMKYNPIIRNFAQRLEKQGKVTKVIIVASMRKLLHIAYGVIKNRTPFDPEMQPA